MTVMAPCLGPIDPGAPCTVERAIVEALETCDLGLVWDCTGAQCPTVPYGTVTLLDAGEGERFCSGYLFTTILRVRIYANTLKATADFATGVVECLRGFQSESLMGKFCIPKPGWPNFGQFDAVHFAQINFPINIVQT